MRSEEQFVTEKITNWRIKSSKFDEILIFDLNTLSILNHIEMIESNGLDIQTILLEEYDEVTTEKILQVQDTLNDMLFGDHLRVIIKKN